MPPNGVEQRERAFDHRIGRRPCTTPADARQLLSFASSCVRGTPLGDGFTPWYFIADQQPLREAVRLVEEWLACYGVPRRGFAALNELAQAAATTAAGPFDESMAGYNASYWAAAHLV